MIKDSFLDTNVIINYINYQKERSSEIVNRCYLYVINKKGLFIVWHAVIRELYNIIAKLAVIHKEVLAKIENENYSLKDSKNLSKRDVPFAEKLYLTHKDPDNKSIRETFASQRDIFEIGIERFLKEKVDKKVIPLEQISIELVNALREIITNYADCQILSSALQYQKNEEIFLFVTADGKDLSPNGYDFLKEQFGINNPKEENKFPELLNLMFTKI